MFRQCSLGAFIICLALLAAGGANAEDVVRLPLIGSDFPISAAVNVHGGVDTVYVSGTLPP